MTTDPLDIEKTLDPGAASSPSDSSAYTLSPGQTLGQYKIVRALGKGGMGEVYEAEHQVLRRRYALKLLPAEFARQSGALERFQREAQVMANLEHPNIVRVDEFGETTGRYWLRMELADGIETGNCKHAVSLQELADAGNGRIKQQQLAGILKQILDALSYAHERGAIHRDLKPSNILFSGNTAKISDFGLVRLVGEDWVRSQAQLSVQRSISIGDMRTMQGQGDNSTQGSSTRSMLGTFEYMSPEQKRGEDATAQSDLYAVGLMAFKLLTGQNPGLKPPSRIDAALSKDWDGLLEIALEEARADRWPSAAKMREVLAGIVRGIEHDDPRRQAEQKAEQRLQQEEAQKQSEAAAGKIQAEREAAKHPGISPVELVAQQKIADPQNPVVGQNWASPSTGMEFVWIDALQMWIGKFEVTNDEYRVMMPNHSSGSYSIGTWLKTSYSLNDNRQPVVYVNFKDAKAYAEWLTQQDHAVLSDLRYRLPSEVEWMTYAQCGDGREYPWGNEWPPPSGQAGNYHGEESAGSWSKISDYNDGFPVTAPVDRLWRNPWGLHGVGGNVWEACARDSTGGSFVAWRGASWANLNQDDLRCSSRYEYNGSFRFDYYGFRLVLSR